MKLLRIKTLITYFRLRLTASDKKIVRAYNGMLDMKVSKKIRKELDDFGLFLKEKGYSIEERKKIVYIDMDDTICDYKAAYKYQKEVNPQVEFPQSKEGFFLNLEPLKAAIESVNKLRGKHDVWILTRPSYMNPYCYLEKRLWIEKYFGLDFCKKLILCPDKSLLIGDILIDDVEWKDFQGKQILFRDWENTMKEF